MWLEVPEWVAKYWVDFMLCNNLVDDLKVFDLKCRNHRFNVPV